MDKTPPARETLTKGKVVLFYPTPGISQYFWFPFPYLYLGPFLEREGYQVVVIDARTTDKWRQLLMNEIRDADAVGMGPSLWCLGLTLLRPLVFIPASVQALVPPKPSNFRA